jgi:hydrogenase-1 operon protein HyaF
MKQTLEQIPVVLVGPDDVPTGMVPALLRELDEALQALMARGTGHMVDLSTLPLSKADRRLLDRMLGEGEMRMDLETLGHSRIRESAFPGIWWVRHEDPDGNVLADRIEVAHIPEIVPASACDVASGQARLAETIQQLTSGSER